MRVLIVADAMFAKRERTLLQRLEVALTDEGHGVAQAVPRELLDQGGSELYVRWVGYASTRLPLLRQLAVRRLAAGVRLALAEAGEHDDQRGVDVVHAFGGACWDLASEAAEELGAGLVLEVWRSGLAGSAAERLDSSPVPTLLTAPDAPIRRALQRRRVGDGEIIDAPWGVLAADERTILQPGRAWSIMLIGSGRDGDAFTSALAGLAPLLREADTGPLVFCDAAAARRSDLWRAARTLGVLDKLSLIENLEGRRDLLLMGDVLVCPEASGEQRGAVLEAMGAGLLVLAAKDPEVSVLADGQTAQLVDAKARGAWERAFRSVVTMPDAARAVAQAARRYVVQHRRASDYVRRVMAAYARLAPGGIAPGDGQPSPPGPGGTGGVGGVGGVGAGGVGGRRAG